MGQRRVFLGPGPTSSTQTRMMMMNNKIKEDIYYALREAIEKIGVDNLRQGPFFGIGYKIKQEN